MEYRKSIGTGESLVTTPLEIRVQLNNLKIDRDEAEILTRIVGIFFKDMRPVTINLVKRTRNGGTWGSANKNPRRINLYRHSVAIFLHEIAHIFTSEYEHGRAFANTLDRIYGLYFIYLKTKKAKKG